MRTKIIMPIIAFIGLSCFVVLGSSPDLVGNFLESVSSSPVAEIFLTKTQTESQISTLPSGEKTQVSQVSSREISGIPNEVSIGELPEYMLYEQVFRLIIIFNDLAKSQEAKGEAVTQFRSYFKDEAKLDAQDDDFLTQTANNFNREIQIIDAQAEVVIEQLRQQYPVGSMPEGQLIQPSPELLKLQEQRNNLALHYRDQIRVLFGDDKFNEFETLVLGSFASTFRAMPVSSIPNGKNQGVE